MPNRGKRELTRHPEAGVLEELRKNGFGDATPPIYHAEAPFTREEVWQLLQIQFPLPQPLKLFGLHPHIHGK